MTGASSAIEVRVRYAETDQQGVAYHANYLVWMEIGRTELLRGLGFPYDRLERSGVFFVVSEATCRYRGAARYDDRVRIETRVRRVRSRSVDFDYELSVEGRRIADGRTTLLAMDSARRPRRVPPEIATALQDPGP